jgi:predicted ArsR family transcriptional regulator
LRNCPFHCLADEDRELVCGMNLSFVQGLLEGVGADQASAALDPSSSGCCVRIAIG